MPRFTSETAIAALELQQLVADWCNDLDANGGRNVTQFFSEDCVVAAGRIDYKGRAAMKKFYEDRNERVRTQQKNGVRTARHGFTNLRISFENKDRATLNFLVINYSHEGAAPILNATTPTIVSDARFECRREADGEWRVFGFYGAPIFVGNDPFLNQTVVGDIPTQ